MITPSSGEPVHSISASATLVPDAPDPSVGATAELTDTSGASVSSVAAGSTMALHISVVGSEPLTTLPEIAEADHALLHTANGSGELRFTDVITHNGDAMSGGSQALFPGWYVEADDPAPGTYTLSTPIRWQPTSSLAASAPDLSTGKVTVTVTVS